MYLQGAASGPNILITARRECEADVANLDQAPQPSTENQQISLADSQNQPHTETPPAVADGEQEGGSAVNSFAKGVNPAAVAEGTVAAGLGGLWAGRKFVMPSAFSDA